MRVYNFGRSRLLSSLILGAACIAGSGAGCTDEPGDADDKAPGQWAPGKGDGAFDIVEAGPAVAGEKISIKLDGRIGAYRIESFGGTAVQIDVKGSSGVDAYVIVEGPLANDGDGVGPGTGRVVAEDDDSGPVRDARVKLTLTEPGVYRILPGTFDSLRDGARPTGTVALTVTCSAVCTRPSIDQKSLVRQMQAHGPAFTEIANAEIAALIPNAAMAAQLGAQLTRIMADPNLTGLERFPTIPLAMIATARPLLGGIKADPANPDKVMHGELAQVLGSCSPDRALPTAVDARLPGLGYGHFPNRALSPCQAAHAAKLAQLLTSLAADNGSSVTLQSKTIKTPAELFAALVATGHSIEVRNERMYANFLSMAAGDRDVIWPVWLDTGIKLSNGENFVVPMGHSHHAWRIAGPSVNTRVMFYLGTSGAGFFGQTDLRPAWNGLKVATASTVTKTSDADYQYLLKTVDTAATYMRRTRIERSTVAAGMPADGYGYVGVCNDSNAVIEFATKKTITTFPLLRAKQLDAAADLGDGLDAVLRALPKDSDDIGGRDALRRAYLVQPHAADSALMWDPALGSQIALARAELGL
ncbi:MAG: hypothetical protein KBG15_16785 [Kofleriaceae bacterium]|nr:hypothetical protein [Kofleriaceae bacterium]